MKDKMKKRLASLFLSLCLTAALPVRAAAAGDFFPPGGADTPSLADALAALGEDGSYAYRAGIAEANGYRDYAGTAGQNTALLYLLRRGRLRRPDRVLSPVEANVGKVSFLPQEPKTCKASAAAMAVNLLLGRDGETTESMGSRLCRSIEGETFVSPDGRTWVGLYRTDGYTGTRDALLAAMEEAVRIGVPMVIPVHSTASGTRHHWVLLLGKEGDDWRIADPARTGCGSIEANAVTLLSRSYALGLADYETLHYGYVTFLPA